MESRQSENTQQTEVLAGIKMRPYRMVMGTQSGKGRVGQNRRVALT